MARPLEIPSTVVAVDWSGAKEPATQRKAISVAVATADGITATGDLTRAGAVDLVARLAPPVVAGFDFSFSFPAWFAAALGCASISEVWERAAARGETWLGPPPVPPFWRDGCRVPPDRRYRRCEHRLRPAKSVFQLVGNGQVGAGSVRGMPFLERLRAGGFAIWPFDPPAARTAVEIYPSRLRPLAPADVAARAFASEHERDAVLSAAVMWEHRASFGLLEPASDELTRLEGDVWMPNAVAPGAAPTTSP